jgi:hypothetical protein
LLKCANIILSELYEYSNRKNISLKRKYNEYCVAFDCVFLGGSMGNNYKVIIYTINRL